MDWITRKEIFQIERESKPKTPTLVRRSALPQAVVDGSDNSDKNISALKNELKNILAKKEERSGMYSTEVPVYVMIERCSEILSEST